MFCVGERSGVVHLGVEVEEGGHLGTGVAGLVGEGDESGVDNIVEVLDSDVVLSGVIEGDEVLELILRAREMRKRGNKGRRKGGV